MRINITLDVTPGTARRLALVGVTLLVVGATAAADAVPVTFVSQQRLTAAQLNENFADLDSRLLALGDALVSKADTQQVPDITEWQAYDCDVTTNKGIDVGQQKTIAFYRRVGDTLEGRLHTTFSGSPNTGAAWWQWSLPAGLLIDMAKVGPVGALSVGNGSAYQSGQSVALDGYVRTTQSVSGSSAGASSIYVKDTTPVVFEHGGQVALDFRVPIQGWSTSP